MPDEPVKPSNPRSNELLLPQTAEYALRAMAWIALQPEGTAVRGKDLSKATDIPSHYLSKVLRRLVVARLLVSQRGHGGGFVLARSRAAINFGEILAAVDAAPGEADRCAFGWGSCDFEHPCPLHQKWSEMQDEFRRWAEHTTLADIDDLDPVTLKLRQN